MSSLGSLWLLIQNEILGMKWLNRLIGKGLSAMGLDLSSPVGGSIQFFLYDVLSGSDGFSSDTGSALCGNGIRTEGENCPGTSCEPGMTVGRYAGEVPWMSFDIIVSNPPYVRESEKRLMHRNVLEHEPGLALFVPDDDPLLFYRAIADFAGKRLNAGGFGAVEINEAFGEAVAGIFSASGLHDVRTVEDFRAKIRFVTFRK